MARDKYLTEIVTKAGELSENEFEKNWQIFSSIILHNLEYCQYRVNELMEKGVQELETVDTVYNDMLTALHNLAQFFDNELKK